jgi:hypothetical protein
MNQIRFLIGIVLMVVLFLVIQLPDPARLASPENRYSDLPAASIQGIASLAAGGGQTGAAILLLDYVGDNRLIGAADAGLLADQYRAMLESDDTPQGRLNRVGNRTGQGSGDWFGSLAGASVADFFTYGNMSDQAWQKLFRERNDQFIAALDNAAPISAFFPSAEPALNLLKVCRINGILNVKLVNQQMEVLNFMKNSTNAILAVSVAGDSIMPVYQLARKCRTWAEFESIVKSAESVDQVKILTRMASVTPGSARKLAQILVMSRCGAHDLSGQCIDFALRAGQGGMDRLYAGIRKGQAGLDFVLRNPGTRIPMDDSVSASYLDGTKTMTRWKSYAKRHNLRASALKYSLIGLLCIGICFVVMPPAMFYQIFRASAGDSESGRQRIRLAYAGAVVMLSISLCILLLLKSVLPPDKAAFPPDLAGISMPVDPAAQSEQNPLSVLMLVVVVIMSQGPCWWAARRKILEIQRDKLSDPALRLRRLENLDIFFDLPLYSGLALTICAFILITTFGVGVSRFLAYSTTFAGIIMSVLLRVGYLYPLREELIGQKK